MKLSCSFCNSKGNAQNCICTKIAFGFCSVKFDHFLINTSLIGNIHSVYFFGNDIIYIMNSFQDSFSKVAAFITISELKSFIFTC